MPVSHPGSGWVVTVPLTRWQRFVSRCQAQAVHAAAAVHSEQHCGAVSEGDVAVKRDTRKQSSGQIPATRQCRVQPQGAHTKRAHTSARVLSGRARGRGRVRVCCAGAYVTRRRDVGRRADAGRFHVCVDQKLAARRRQRPWRGARSGARSGARRRRWRRRRRRRRLPGPAEGPFVCLCVKAHHGAGAERAGVDAVREVGIGHGRAQRVAEFWEPARKRWLAVVPPEPRPACRSHTHTRTHARAASGSNGWDERRTLDLAMGPDTGLPEERRRDDRPH